MSVENEYSENYHMQSMPKKMNKFYSKWQAFFGGWLKFFGTQFTLYRWNDGVYILWFYIGCIETTWYKGKRVGVEEGGINSAAKCFPIKKVLIKGSILILAKFALFMEEKFCVGRLLLFVFLFLNARITVWRTGQTVLMIWEESKSELFLLLIFFIRISHVTEDLEVYVTKFFIIFIDIGAIKISCYDDMSLGFECDWKHFVLSLNNLINCNPLVSTTLCRTER